MKKRLRIIQNHVHYSRTSTIQGEATNAMDSYILFSIYMHATTAGHTRLPPLPNPHHSFSTPLIRSIPNLSQGRRLSPIEWMPVEKLLPPEWFRSHLPSDFNHLLPTCLLQPQRLYHAYIPGRYDVDKLTNDKGDWKHQTYSIFKRYWPLHISTNPLQGLHRM